MPHQDAPLERKLSDGARVFGSRAPGEGGTISFLANGKVAVEVGGPAFFEQGRKVVSHFKVDPDLFEELETIFQTPFDDSGGSELLYALVRIADRAQFDRRLDELVGTLRAIRALRIGRFGTKQSRLFVDAIYSLAVEFKRPPTKSELEERLCVGKSEISLWCKEHGFSWLPKAAAGRPRNR